MSSKHLQSSEKQAGERDIRQGIALDAAYVKTFIDHAPVILWITNPDGYCVYLNEKWYEYTGQSIEEAVGRGWLNSVHPEDLSRTGDIFQEAISAQKTFRSEYRLRDRFGNYRWMLDAGSPKFDSEGQYEGFAGTVIDIHDRKLAESRQQESEERLRLAVESAELGTWDLNPLTGELTWSDRCRELFGLPAGSPVDYNLFLAGLHPEDRQRTDDIVQTVLRPGSDGLYDIEYRTVGLVDNKLRWVKAKGRALHEDGAPIAHRFIGTVLDITEVKAKGEELEQHVAERTRELQEANTNLERSNYSLQQFAYVASHDLQEPLRKIQAFSDVLEQEYAAHLPPGAYDILNRMRKSAQRMNSLVRDLLSFSRLTTRQEPSQQVPLQELIGEVLGDLETTLQQTSAEVTVCSLPVLTGNRTQLRQLFQNLLTNAIKFTQPGQTPHVRVSSRKVASAELPEPTTENRQWHLIEVKDNGIGFDAKYIERIFELFQRLHGKSQYEGTGIGLAICKKVVENHGGQITAHSQPGQGATFQIYLPG
ncbi:PAS domain-containing protein [Tellurirhabdus rosea]|uniref:PAS domain-containing protein n=1 Tax=Tellurirhabdus rosea TaxID=2674997 RepID=UPI00224CE6C0|nr:PAS domain-containing protein [Tellurirhabdus rosea]